LRGALQQNSLFTDNGRRYGDLRRLLRRVVDYLGITPEEVDKLKPLEDEIRHFKHISVSIHDIGELKRKAEGVRNYEDPARKQEELILRLQQQQITVKEFREAYTLTNQQTKEGSFEYEGKRIAIKHIAQHYYLPVVLSEDGKADYIRHIIRTPSEVKFIRELETYLAQPNNRFQQFDWWFFSKLDESLDEVYIPYYDPKTNRMARFKPDFIFWLCKGDRYWIVFIDPKGTEHTDFLRKIDGYREVFENDGQPKCFRYNDKKVTVHLFLKPSDSADIPTEYQSFGVDNVEFFTKGYLWCN
jgi:DNA-binding transcriptional MerR regulator